MERIGLKRAASLGALAGVAVIAVRMVVGDVEVGDAVGAAGQALGGALGGAFLFSLGAVVINAIRGR